MYYINKNMVINYFIYLIEGENMRRNIQYFAKLFTLSLLVATGLCVTNSQNVFAEYTKDEQHLTGVEANNLKGNREKYATMNDYKEMVTLAKKTGFHYLDKPIRMYAWYKDINKDGIYYFSDNGTGKYVKGNLVETPTKNKQMTPISVDEWRIIGACNIDGKGYLISHDLDDTDQYLIRADNFILPKRGYEVRKHHKIPSFYTKTGKKIKKPTVKMCGIHYEDFLVSKEIIKIKGQKYRRAYGSFIYGTSGYENIFYLKEKDIKKLKPATYLSADAGVWIKAKGYKNYDFYKPSKKYYKYTENDGYYGQITDKTDPKKIKYINNQYSDPSLNDSNSENYDEDEDY